MSPSATRISSVVLSVQMMSPQNLAAGSLFLAPNALIPITVVPISPSIKIYLCMLSHFELGDLQLATAPRGASTTIEVLGVRAERLARSAK